MCGIIWIKRKDGKPAQKMALKRYKKQQSRGQSGFGYIALEKNKIVSYNRSETEEAIKTLVEKEIASEILFHHRFPTSTPNFAMSAHPIKVSNDLLKHDYYVIHNGVIYGDSELKKNHEKLGFKYNTELVKTWKSFDKVVCEETCWNDSESLAIELALDLDKDGKGVEVDGSVAFIALQTAKNSSKTLKMFFGRNDGSPLKINSDKHFLSITSEGGGEIVKTHTLGTLDYKTDEITYRPYVVGDDWSNRVARQRAIGFTSGYSGYSHGGTAWGYSRDEWEGNDLIEDEADYHELKAEAQELVKLIVRSADDGLDEDEIQGARDRLLVVEDAIRDYEGRGF